MHTLSSMFVDRSFLTPTIVLGTLCYIATVVLMFRGKYHGFVQTTIQQWFLWILAADALTLLVSIKAKNFLGKQKTEEAAAEHATAKAEETIEAKEAVVEAKEEEESDGAEVEAVAEEAKETVGTEEVEEVEEVEEAEEAEEVEVEAEEVKKE